MAGQVSGAQDHISFLAAGAMPTDNSSSAGEESPSAASGKRRNHSRKISEHVSFLSTGATTSGDANDQQDVPGCHQHGSLAHKTVAGAGASYSSAIKPKGQINVHPLSHFLTNPPPPLSSLPRGIMSLSLGAPLRHSIDSKILACVAQGWQGIEIHIDDIRTRAKASAIASASTVAASGGYLNEEQTRCLSNPAGYEPDRQEMIVAAHAVAALCQATNLTVICLEPFLHYPGMLPLAARNERLRTELPLWMEISDILGTDVIQVASAMFGAEQRPGTVTGDPERNIEDLKLLAAAGKAWPTRVKYFAYEAMCFGAYCRTWRQAWEQIEKVNEDNFGMVLDTFQILGGAIADPGRTDGLVEGWQQILKQECDDLVSTFAGEANESKRRKLFFCQLGDASLPPEPINEQHPAFDPKQHGEQLICFEKREFVIDACRTCHLLQRAL